MTRNKEMYDEEFETQYGALMRLVEAIILRVLDDSSLSNKWTGRKLSKEVLLKKRAKLNEMRKWFDDKKWDTWLNIYCEYYGYSKSDIQKNFIKIRKKSTKELNQKIKALKNEN